MSDVPEPTPLPDVEPEFHFLVLAPGLQQKWFFVAARRYWQRFRPTVLSDTELIEFVPPDRAIAITTLARSDTAGYMREQILLNFPESRHDELIYDTVEAMQAALDARVDLDQRFG